jgi:hypothetical protein
MAEASFMLKVVDERGGAIRFIRAVEDGNPCWFYLRLDPVKAKEYQQKIQQGNLDIRDYGRILESDWGDYPTEDVVLFMKEEYGFVTPPPAGA